MSVAPKAAARRLETPRIKPSARAGQAFEPKPAAFMGQHSLHVVERARGALGIDVPRNEAASPCGRVATPAVGEQGLERLRVKRSPLLPPERGA